MPPTLYYGNQERKLDYKGRVGLPDDLLGSGAWTRAVLVRGWAELADLDPSPCLYLFDIERWQNMLAAATRRASMDANEMRLFQHRMVADAATVDVDGVKRITVPERLLEHAKVRRQESVHFVGNFTNIEIWNPSVYAAHIEAMEKLDVSVPDLVDLARQADVHEVS